MRSHRRRTPTDHVLIAGRTEDLAGIARILGALSADAYGQVLIEVPAGVRIPSFTRPPRVTVCRITAAPPNDRGDTPLTAAIAAWMAEWMPEDPDADRAISIWVGAQDGSHVDAQCHVLGDLVERI